MRAALLVLLGLTVALASAPARAEPPRSAPGLAYYENPQTLGGVARRFHLTVSEIAALNGIEDPARFHAHGLLLPDTPSTRGLPRYVPWAAAPPRSTCAVHPWTLHHASVKGCADAYCASGPAGARSCLCRDAQGEVAVRMSSAKGPPATIPVDLSVFNPYGSSMVDIASVDLDGDGEQETLVSWLTAVSNGIAAEYRTLVVLRAGRELLRYDSGEFTAQTAGVVVGGRCHLAASHYEEATHPLRGPALHLVERTFDPLRMTMDAELVGRRCSDTSRFVIPFDPLTAGSSASLREPGTIAHLKRDAGGSLRAVSFRTASSTRKLQVDANVDELRFGDAVARRLFPPGLAEPSLGGRTATLERLGPDGTRVLWLGQRRTTTSQGQPSE